MKTPIFLIPVVFSLGLYSSANAQNTPQLVNQFTFQKATTNQVYGTQQEAVDAANSLCSGLVSDATARLTQLGKDIGAEVIGTTTIVPTTSSALVNLGTSNGYTGSCSIEVMSKDPSHVQFSLGYSPSYKQIYAKGSEDKGLTAANLFLKQNNTSIGGGLNQTPINKRRGKVVAWYAVYATDAISNIPLCTSLNPKRTQVGDRCLTSRDIFERVNQPGFSQAWKDLGHDGKLDGLVWSTTIGDFLNSGGSILNNQYISTPAAYACFNLGGALPTKDDFQTGMLSGMPQLFSHIEKSVDLFYWTSTVAWQVTSPTEDDPETVVFNSAQTKFNFGILGVSDKAGVRCVSKQ